MKKRNYLIFLMALIIATGASCSSTSNDEQRGPSQMEGQDPSEMDVDGDGLISRDEAEGILLDSFDEIDSNSDGYLSQTELKSYRDSSMGQQGGQSQMGQSQMGQGQNQSGPQMNQSQGSNVDAASVMKALDADGDDQISLSEAKGPLSDSFESIDTDGDGFISIDELTVFISSQVPKSNQEQGQSQTMDAKSIINSMDKDGDDKISRNEAQGPILQMFDQIDTNSDSMLTEEEITISMNSLKDASQIGVVKNDMIAANTEAVKSEVVVSYKDEIDDGYSLIAPIDGTEVYLVDMDGNKVFSFDTESKIALDAQILDDGSILGSFDNDEDGWTDKGSAGIVKLFNSDGDLSWTYNYSSDAYCSHHDVLMMENGDVAIIAWNKISNSEASENGVDTSVLDSDGIWPDSIVEVDPKTNEIVWTWNSWDHIVQDINPDAKNYGDVSQNPNLIDINYTGKSEDVMHCNGIEYDADRNVFYLSSMAYGEIWVIDRSTTSEEAASHEGGNYGVGGDLVYRFGNPRAYGNDEGSVVSTGQHAPSLTDEGTLLVFVNRMVGKRAQSEVVEFDLTKPFSLLSDHDNEPNVVWQFTNKNLYSQNTSSATRLENGNTLICEGDYGLWEVNADGNIVWKLKYIDGDKKHVSLFQSKRYYFDGEAVSNLGIDGSILK
jgi:Ca2+-binding EF-hand superfamily protein